MKNFIFLINALLLAFCVKAQGNIPLETWRVHLPYQTIISVEEANNRIYASSSINAFYYDYTDNSLNILSKVNALSDIEISKIRYHKGLDMVVIGYSNGNIDIIKNNTTTNLTDIKRKSMVGSKTINEISFKDNFAYVCCDFGVCVIDLLKLQIMETYSSLALGGLSNKVLGCSFSKNEDSIFLATEKGVMVGKISPSVNLMDYNNWFTYGSAQGIPSSNVKGIANFMNTIFAAVEGKGLYFLSNDYWLPSSIPIDNGIWSIRNINGKLVITAGSRILIASDSLTYYYAQELSAFYSPREATLDSKGNIWIGDSYYGLFTNKGSSSFYSLKPNGPPSTEVFDMTYYDNTIAAVPGAYNAAYNFTYHLGDYYLFNNGTWTDHNLFYTTSPPVKNCLDFIKVSYCQSDQKLYFASFGFGVVSSNPDNTYSLIDDTIAGFTRWLPQPGPYVYILDAEPDNSGNLVVLAFVKATSDPSLYIRNTNGTWSSKSFGIAAAKFPVEVVIDNNNYYWIRLRSDQGGGIIVYNSKTGAYKYLTDQKGQGGLPDKSVTAITKDLNGDIWAATGGGMAVFYNTQNIFSNPEDASVPIFNGFPLLYNESVTCIKADGGNRKWIGTHNGIWLLNEDGTEVVNYFTENNSPLLSNKIMDVEINDISGEVFIATDKGIISYRGSATASSKNYQEVKVFPNPVAPNFNGLISISGLTTNSNVKVTDIYGTMIYQTTAEGGTAVWNGKNYNGNRAEPGVYLIFSASSDGVEHNVAKIAIE